MKLHNVILQLNAADYSQIVDDLQQNKAEKFSTLLRLYRESELTEDEIHGQLGINQSAFYTLKSRLFDKIQTQLLKATPHPRMEMLRNVANIHKLLHETHRDLAVAMLTKLEQELLEHDMPNELTAVYNALKKLHLHSPKYYEYTQLYNKHVAYTLALDKAESLLASYCKTLEEYSLSRNPDQAQVLWLTKKEIRNVCRLYQSHHLLVTQYIADISFALFVKTPEAIKEDLPVEEMLDILFETFDNHTRDERYYYLRDTASFLAFEYYHGLGLSKSATPYFDKISPKANTFLLHSHTCFAAHFLISRLEFLSKQDRLDELESEEQALHFETSPEELAAYCFVAIHHTMRHFYAGRYLESTRILNQALNEAGLKNYTHTEIELKLLQALCCCMCNRYEQADLLLRSVSRKLTELNKSGEYEQAGIFVKMLRLQMNSESKGVEEKLRGMRDRFLLLNNGNKRMLGYVRMDDTFIKKLSLGVKSDPTASRGARG